MRSARCNGGTRADAGREGETNDACEREVFRHHGVPKQRAIQRLVSRNASRARPSSAAVRDARDCVVTRRGKRRRRASCCLARDVCCWWWSTRSVAQSWLKFVDRALGSLPIRSVLIAATALRFLFARTSPPRNVAAVEGDCRGEMNRRGRRSLQSLSFARAATKLWPSPANAESNVVVVCG